MRGQCSPRHQAAGAAAVQREQKGAMTLYLLSGGHDQLKPCEKALRYMQGLLKAEQAGEGVEARTRLFLFFLLCHLLSPHPLPTSPVFILPHLAPAPQVPLNSFLVVKIPSLPVCLGPFSLPFNALPPSRSPQHPLTPLASPKAFLMRFSR